MANNMDILHEIKDLAPTLASIPRKNAYGVPHGYFSSLGKQVIGQVLLESTSPRHDNYEVPDGYFEDFNKRVIDRIDLDDSWLQSDFIPAMRTPWYIKALWPVVGIAAVFALVIVFYGRSYIKNYSENTLAQFVEDSGAFDKTEQFILFGDVNNIWQAEHAEELLYDQRTDMLDELVEDIFAIEDIAETG